MDRPSKRPVIHSQTRKLVYNVYLYLKEKNPDLTERKLHLEISQACRLSYSTIYRILKEALLSPGEEKTFCTPRKKRPRKKSITALDDFDLCVVRRVIHEFHSTEKELPTLKGILRLLKEKINYMGSVSSIRTIIRDLGFRWKKTQNNRKLLMEKTDIRNVRVQYLRKIKEYREEGRPIVYMDETYFHGSSCSENSWTDSDTSGLKKPVSKGQRVIVVHAGGEMGFVPNALLMFKSGQKKGNYHDDMNKDNYERWLKEKLIPNLQPNSVVVVDNAPYHCVKLNPAPTSASAKGEMLKWLDERDIFHSQNLLKPELYHLILQHKPRYVTYKIDSILAAAGHSILRLPPYHPDLNPIEMIWATVKCHIKRKNVKFTVESVKTLAEQKFSEITVDDWKSRCAHVKKIEEEYMVSEGMMDEVSERLVINLNNGQSESDSESEFSEVGRDDGGGSAHSDLETDMSGIEEIDIPFTDF